MIGRSRSDFFPILGGGGHPPPSVFLPPRQRPTGRGAARRSVTPMVWAIVWPLGRGERMTGKTPLRSVDKLITPDVRATVQNIPDLTDADRAAVKLATLYATAIDNTPPELAFTVLEKLGPRLLAALEALGATPRARAARKGGAGAAKVASKLEQIRAARRTA